MNGQRPQFHSIPLRARRPGQTQAPNKSYVSHAAMPAMPDEDQMFVTRATSTSAIRYTDEYGRETRLQGNKRLVIDKAEPPKRIRLHWMLFTGLGMLAMLVLWQLGTMSLTAWNNHQLDSTYGMPRTYQIDENVGHKGISHFIFENEEGHIFFIEVLLGDMGHSHLYTVTTLFGPNAASVPVTAIFEDVNHDGRVDIVLHIGTDGPSIAFLNDGTGFKPQTQQ